MAGASSSAGWRLQVWLTFHACPSRGEVVPGCFHSGTCPAPSSPACIHDVGASGRPPAGAAACVLAARRTARGGAHAGPSSHLRCRGLASGGRRGSRAARPAPAGVPARPRAAPATPAPAPGDLAVERGELLQRGLRPLLHGGEVEGGRRRRGLLRPAVGAGGEERASEEEERGGEEGAALSSLHGGGYGLTPRRGGQRKRGRATEGEHRAARMGLAIGA